MSQPLTRIQISERAKRRRNRLLQFGVRQCPGTKPRGFRPASEPVWRPMPKPAMPDLLERLTSMFRWMRPKRAPEKVDKL